MLFAMVAVAVAGTQPPVVATASGKVMGAWESVFGVELAAFRGIPYASPPVGEGGRWMPPSPPVRARFVVVCCHLGYSSCSRVFQDSWSGILNATQGKPACYEYGSDLAGHSEVGCGVCVQFAHFS